MRSDRIPLPADEPRCEPSQTCHVRSRCARATAAIPARGAKLEDYSLGTGGGTAVCLGYVDASSLRKAVQAPPRAHPPIGGARD